MSAQKILYPDLGKPKFADKLLNVVAKRYFAGTNVPALLERLQKINHPVVLDLLGENGSAAGNKQQRADRTKLLSDIIVRQNLKASIAVRPGQFENDCELMLRVIDYTAGANGVFTWIDMEKRAVVDMTLLAHLTAVQKHPGKIGLAVQAYLDRTESDIGKLIELAAMTGLVLHIRPVRGVYVQEADVQNISEMHNNLARIMRMLAVCDVPTVYQHVASHDPFQMARAVKLREKYGERVASIQLLLGVYSKMADAITVSTGMPTEMYVPFGPSTAAYLSRRLEEAGGAVYGLFMARAMEGANHREFLELAQKCHMNLKSPILPFSEIDQN